MPTIVLNELPWRPAQQTLLPLAEAAGPVTTRLGEHWPMSIFEHVRKALITLLRAERVEFDPPPRALARGVVGRRLERVQIRAFGVDIDDTDVTIDELDVVAEDVQLRLTWRGPTLHVGTATFTARLSEQQLTELVPLPMGVDRLSVTPRGCVFHTIAGIAIYTTVTLADDRILVAPTTPAKVPLLDLLGIDIDIPQLPAAGGLEQLSRFGLSFDVPQLPGNATITDLDLGAGFAEISGTLDLTGATGVPGPDVADDSKTDQIDVPGDNAEPAPIDDTDTDPADPPDRS